jgi:hypothetical protein
MIYPVNYPITDDCAVVSLGKTAGWGRRDGDALFSDLRRGFLQYLVSG